ncbi:hypothetical protein [Mesobacillus foraminis]|uniref:Uncharacterized protein n=1 Tax=Mesobacillus foraminis TaxID=279826 RepID=A0A4R2B2I7_9BACI|nr:hypothetical protein [Mesobacillus foraminis]TCN19724.1 hypothetical protein EV146_11626 [Mesobacillus foraminis]
MEKSSDLVQVHNWTKPNLSFAAIFMNTGKSIQKPPDLTEGLKQQRVMAENLVSLMC